MTTVRDPAVDASGSPAATTPARDDQRSFVQRLRPDTPAQLVQMLMLSVLVASVLILCVVNPTFRQTENLLNVLQQASLVGVIAGGMQLMIISGGFDLSVGAVAAAAGCVAAWISLRTSIPVAILAGLATGLVAGFGNGLLIAKLGINPFVATFGSQAVVTGLLLAATDAKPIAPLPDGWTTLGLTELLGLSFASVVFIGVMSALWFILRATVFGQHIYAVGSNKEGGRRAGVRVDRVLVTVYTIGGVLAAVAGILLVAISGIGHPNAGSTWALLAIAAVIIGGTPLTGGVGGISSAVVGILILTVLTNALNLYGISAFWQPTVTGTAVLLAVGYESYRSKRKR